MAESFKQAMLNATQKDVVLIRSPVGLPGRAIRTPFVDQLKNDESGLKAKKCVYKCLKKCDHVYCISERLMQARDGNIEDGLVFSGENVYKMRDILTVKEVFDQFVGQAESVYKENTEWPVSLPA